MVGPDGELGGIIVGITFLIMGLPALWFTVADLVSSVRRRDERPTLGSRAAGVAERGVGKILGAPVKIERNPPSRPSGGAPRSTDARLDQLERLERLRSSGALTEAEFEREKARILGS